MLSKMVGKFCDLRAASADQEDTTSMVTAVSNIGQRGRCSDDQTNKLTRLYFYIEYCILSWVSRCFFVRRSLKAGFPSDCAGYVITIFLRNGARNSSTLQPVTGQAS